MQSIPVSKREYDIEFFLPDRDYSIKIAHKIKAGNSNKVIIKISTKLSINVFPYPSPDRLSFSIIVGKTSIIP